MRTARCGSGRPDDTGHVRTAARVDGDHRRRLAQAVGGEHGQTELGLERRADAPRGSRRRRSTPRRATPGRRAPPRPIVARLCSSAGGPFHVVTRSVRIHSATPSASMRSITIEHPPACDTSSVVSTAMLRIVNGKQSPLRRSEPYAAGRHEHRARRQQVVLAVHRALRVAGGAARVRDARRARTDRRPHRADHRRPRPPPPATRRAAAPAHRGRAARRRRAGATSPSRTAGTASRAAPAPG